MQKYNENLDIEFLSCGKNNQQKRQNETKLYATGYDSGMVVFSSVETVLAEFDRFLHFLSIPQKTQKIELVQHAYFRTTCWD